MSGKNYKTKSGLMVKLEITKSIKIEYRSEKISRIADCLI